MWQVGAWGSCAANATGVCGESVGTQTGELTCEKDTGEIRRIMIRSIDIYLS